VALAVLVVGGDVQTRGTAVTVVEDAHMSWAEAGSAEDALAYLREHAPDVQLILTDFELPGRLDGIDVARVAALRWPWMKVVVMTAGERFRDVPANVVFVHKPWSPADLHAQLCWEATRSRASENQQKGRTHEITEPRQRHGHPDSLGFSSPTTQSRA
jgi:CheY-like chemotaxis protein